MQIIIKDRETQYTIYEGYVSINYLKQLQQDTGFTIIVKQ